jgi:tetratricopeptide (TPR) repeat protein
MIANHYEHVWKLIMRFSPAAIALSFTLALISSAGLGKQPDHIIDPKSLALMQTGDEAVQANRPQDAIDWYQTALAVDPRNRQAYIAMARVVRSLGLNGKAISFYKEALELDPNDMVALQEQTDVMITKNAVEPAKKNLARLQMLCRNDCGKVSQLAVAISKLSEKPALQASAVEIKPVVGEAPPPKTN